MLGGNGRGGRFGAEAEKLCPDRREIRRYMGMRSGSTEEGIEILISGALEDLKKRAVPVGIFRREPLAVSGNRICAGGMEIESRSLGKNLAGCGEIVLMAATLGIGVDRLLERYSRLEVSKALALQAAAAAVLEEFCDCFQEELSEILEKDGLYLRPRFSPGYGDFPLEHQRPILERLQASKMIGLTLTGGNMLAPVKSVTAVIGVSREKKSCHRKGCESCEKIDCAFRRE